ncbi:MAG: hypothetical protein GY839_01175 [candidate division Zixibacteria bacterium]|nr:hypothetical protein [candidate division Zixibacteria bacterium]
MLKRSLLFLAILLIMILVIPQIAQPTETPDDSKADVDIILERYIKAIGGRAAIEKFTTLICRAKVITDLRSRQLPVYEEHTIKTYSMIPDSYYLLSQSYTGRERWGYYGDSGWHEDKCGTRIDNQTGWSKLAWLVNPQNALKIKEYFPNLVLGGQKQVDDKTAYYLISTDRDEAHYGLYFDVNTGLLIRIGYYWDLADYKEIDGVLFPHRISTSRKGGSTTYTFEEVTHNEPIDDSKFVMPE